MPVTQRKRSFQLFRKLKFCTSSTDDEKYLDIDKMMLHTLDCIGALQCLMGNRYETSKSKIFWSAVQTIADIGLDALSGHMDKRHPGATHLVRAFPNDAKATDGRGWLPLHWAAVCDNVEAEDVKVIAKADPTATVKGFNQPISANPGHLIAAARHPDMKVVKCLYDFYPRMAYTKDNDGDLPLHYAARYSQSIDMIRYLLQANPSATKFKGDGELIPLQCAIYNEHPASRYLIVKSLIQADPLTTRIINHDGDTALHLAVIQECDEELIKLLISTNEESVKIQNTSGCLPLHMACYSNHPLSETIIDILLNAYPDGAKIANFEGLLPAHFAAAHSNITTLNKIISAYPEAISSISNSCGTPLHQAVIGNNENAVKYICQNFPDSARIPNVEGYLPIHVAAGRENLNIIKMLHQTFPQGIMTFTSDGKLPLHVFAIEDAEHLTEIQKEADILRYLLKVYPDAVDIKDASGNSPFSLSRPSHLFVRRLFLRAKPTLSYLEYLQLNYEPRRMAMFLSFAAINANGEPSIWCKLREENMKLLQLAISFL